LPPYGTHERIADAGYSGLGGLEVAVRRRFAGVALTVLATPAFAEPPNRDGSPEDLRRGGYVVLVSVAALERAAADPDEKPASTDSDRVRRLTAYAKALGIALRKADIPFGKVLCAKEPRVVEIAKAIDVGDVMPAPDLTDDESATGEERER